MDSIAKSELEARLLELAGRTLMAQGFRVVDADCYLANRSLVRLFIERAIADAEVSQDPKSAAVSIDDCAKVSSIMGPLLEVEDLIPGAYDMEVSSPGLDRRLRVRADFERFLGNEVKLKLHDSVEGVGQNPRGDLVSVTESGVLVNVSGKEVEIPFHKIRRANLVWKS